MLEDLVKRGISLPSKTKLLVLGGGFSGQHIAALARDLGASVICSRRKANSPGADIGFDSTNKSFSSSNIIQDVTHLISCIPPDEKGEDPVLISLSKELKAMPLEWVGYLSTTGVYGDCKGNWVNENTMPKPQQLRSKRRLACEQAWQNTGLPLQILRLPGIYGPGRSAIQIIRKGKGKMVDKPGQVFSRIHVDDIAGATIHLINLANKGNRPNVVNITDNLPTANIEVLKYACSLLGNQAPPSESFEIAAKQMSPMALSFWTENRRVSNDILCKELGYELLHPDYKSGLKDCLMQEKTNI